MKSHPLFIALLLFFSCSQKDADVVVYSMQKEKRQIADQKSLDNVKKENSLQWSTPKTWNEKREQGMRVASFQLQEAKADDSENFLVTIISLAGTAGGMVANVNRWRNQLELEPADEEAISKDLTEIKGKYGTFSGLVLENPKTQKGFLAAVITKNGETIFVKAQGKLSTLNREKANYYSFVKSIYE